MDFPPCPIVPMCTRFLDKAQTWTAWEGPAGAAAFFTPQPQGIERAETGETADLAAEIDSEELHRGSRLGPPNPPI